MRRLALGLIPLLSLALMTYGSSVAAAEVLVLTDGTQVQIDQGYQIEGRQVKFTDAEGRLRVMRASEVDLEATETANAQLLAEANAAPAMADVSERPAPVLVLTDDDIGGAAASGLKPVLTMYVTDWCPKCRTAEKFFDQEGVAYVALDVEKDSLAAEEKRSADPNCGGIPLIVFPTGDSMCGFSEKNARRLIAAMTPTTESNELEDDGFEDDGFQDDEFQDEDEFDLDESS